METPTKIGFIGTGNMGGPMAANLAEPGRSLVVHDARREAAAELVAGGAAWAATPAEVARASEVVFLSLPGPRHVEEVLEGANGVFAGIAAGATIIDLSTNSPTVVRRLAEEARKLGVGFLDAPVSGGVRGARKGTLAVMVGGDSSTLARCRPLLESIGEKIFHVGDVGTGNVAKLVNNVLCFLGMLGTAEALVLGAKAGIDLGTLREVVKAGSGASLMWDYGSRAILEDRLPPTFTTTLAAKDIALATALADELGVPFALGERVEELLVGYRDGGFAAEDVLATVKSVEERAGIVVRGRGKTEKKAEEQR
jgi:3-hydroxyisobutyrate dehydrogenase-like beta-hydroxyacid dehydrogenase